MMSSTLHADLLLQQITDPDAQILADTFDSENPAQFIDGLERLAHMLGVSQQINYILPDAQPWKQIWDYILQNNADDIGKTYLDALTQFDNPVRDAMRRAVHQRITAHVAIKNQARAKSKKPKSTDIARWLQTHGYSFRYNVCRGIENNGALLDDFNLKTIQCEMNDIGEPRMPLIEATIYRAAGENRYHPIRDYLNNLSFEGGDPIADLAGYFTSQYGMFAIFLRRWLIGVCAKTLTGAQNRMFVLDGPQGIGKSNFAKWLASPLPAYFQQAEINPHNEDDKRRLGEYWLWEVQELGSSMRKTDWEAIKGYIRQEVVVFRRKYGRMDTILPALTSFIGTINNEEGFLPTADRMFYTEKITAIDWDYAKNMNVHQVWAQAMSLYLAGESWQPTTDWEREQIAAINEDYRVLDPVEETIKKHFKIDPANQNWWLSSMEIMETLKDPNKGNLRVGAEIDARKLARALTKLGLDKPKVKRIGGSLQRGYFGIDYLP